MLLVGFCSCRLYGLALVCVFAEELLDDGVHLAVLGDDDRDVGAIQELEDFLEIVREFTERRVFFVRPRHGGILHRFQATPLRVGDPFIGNAPSPSPTDFLVNSCVS